MEPETELPTEAIEALRRMVLFVCTSATEVGVVGLDRKAAAAAAEDKETLEARLFRKACAAAAVAEGLTLTPLNDCS